MQIEKFYETNKDKARELISQQIIDGWTYQDVCSYWESLGYDFFFIQSVVKPFFVN